MLALEHPQLIYPGSPPPPPPIQRHESARRSAPEPAPSAQHTRISLPAPPAQVIAQPHPHSAFPSTSSSSSSSSSFSTAALHRHPSQSQTYPHLPSPARSVPAFNFHEVPTQDLLRLVADLLTQVAEANMRPEEDRRPMTPPPKLPATEDWERNSRTSIWPSLLTASRKALCMPYPAYSFQARNIPQITIESYLYRILKYCPTTNEVFISLLVYFDRMAHISKEATGSHLFIDKHNIHRLIIAGVTVASKFFSDVFYTNSRYAKVGGLPQHELNQLELQFLVLNDFRLTISTEEMQRYATRIFAVQHDRPLQRPNPDVPVTIMGLPYTGFDADGPRTPQMRPSLALAHHTSSASLASAYSSRAASVSEAETESTDGGGDEGSTDDEPTVRPAWSERGGGDDAESMVDDDDEGDARMASPYARAR